MNNSIPEKIKAREIKRSQIILDQLVASFDKSEKLEDAIIKTFLDPLDVPQGKYSRFNKILLFIQGSEDARGNAAWRNLKRFPLDWSKQVFIMMPKTMTIKDKEKKEEDKTITTGFFFKGLYEISNTYGAKIPEYEKQKPLVMPPLIDVSQKWDIDTKYFHNGDTHAYGYFDQSKNKINLSTHNAGTFFHELAHAAHKKIDGTLKAGQDPQQEAIAQLVSGVLCRMYDQKMDKYTYDYILAYAKDDPKKAMQLISKVLVKVSQVLELILETTNYSKLEIKA